MLQSYEGYVENGRFFAVGGASLETVGRRRAIVTILDEPAPAQSKPSDGRAHEWRGFFDEITKIKDEPVIREEPVKEFEEVNFRDGAFSGISE